MRSLLPYPVVIAHRGAPGAPENSRAGIGRAAELGADLVEVDVRLSLDGVPVLVHDPFLHRTTRSRGPVALTPTIVLRRLQLRGDSGQRLPLLTDALTAVSDGLEIALHLKDRRALGPAPAAVQRHGLESRTWLWLDRPAAARRASTLVPAARITLLNRTARSPAARRRYFDEAQEVGAAAVSVPIGAVAPSLIGEAHQRGLAVFCRAQPSTTLECALAAGLDGVITTDPAAVRRAISDIVPDAASHDRPRSSLSVAP